jgi:hypothetical protein
MARKLYSKAVAPAQTQHALLQVHHIVTPKQWAQAPMCLHAAVAVVAAAQTMHPQTQADLTYMGLVAAEVVAYQIQTHKRSLVMAKRYLGPPQILMVKTHSTHQNIVQVTRQVLKNLKMTLSGRPNLRKWKPNILAYGAKNYMIS